MSQLDLFPLPPASRPNQPTSALAERRHAAQRKTNLSAVVAAIREHPGKTGAEIGAMVGLEYHEARRRVSDAKRLGLIEACGETDCTVTGNKSLCWRATQ